MEKTFHLAGVRRQIEEARAALRESAASAGDGEYDPAYRTGLRSRNLVFHAMRGLAAARGEPLPEMPFTSVPGGSLGDYDEAAKALDAALAVTHDAVQMPACLERARIPYSRYLGWLRDEVGRLMRR
jgi:hypothetical protein